MVPEVIKDCGLKVIDQRSFTLRLSSFPVNLVASIFALTLIGCSDMIEPTEPLLLYPCVLPASLPISSLPFTGTTYHAYGDSITFEFLLPSVQDSHTLCARWFAPRHPDADQFKGDDGDRCGWGSTRFRHRPTGCSGWRHSVCREHSTYGLLDNRNS